MLSSLRPIVWAASVLVVAAATSVRAQADEITLTAADGVKVFGTLSRAQGKSPPVLLLFHMAGSNRAEYAPIAPKLTAAGFTVLAIDQRSGGGNFGAKNRTVDALGRSTSYGEAVKDLEAALEGGRVDADHIEFLLAAGHPKDVAGVLSFSPGEYLGGRALVQTAAAKVTVPVFITQARDREEIVGGRTIFTAVAAVEKTQFIPEKSGVHGSSSLRDDANQSGAGEYWTAVSAFLARFKK